jgi:hypothetical protein
MRLDGDGIRREQTIPTFDEASQDGSRGRVMLVIRVDQRQVG